MIEIMRARRLANPPGTALHPPVFAGGNELTTDEVSHLNRSVGDWGFPFTLWVNPEPMSPAKPAAHTHILEVFQTATRRLLCAVWLSDLDVATANRERWGGEVEIIRFDGTRSIKEMPKVAVKRIGTVCIRTAEPVPL